MFFRDLTGHSKPKKQLRQLVESGHIPHAQIFFGPSGVGKLAFARAFSSYLLCLNPQQGDSCGVCSACNKTHKLIHPDVHFTFPTIGTNVTPQQMMGDWRKLMIRNPFATYQEWLESIGGENKQGNINKETCNQMIKILGLKTFESKEKIWIIWGGEYLGSDGNRLLKLIEEPPEETYIIIILDNIEYILGTIRSRCQALKFNLLSDDEIFETLARWSEADEAKRKGASVISEGSLAHALTVLKDAHNPFSALWSNWIIKVLNNEGYEVSALNDEIAKLSKEQQKYFAHYAILFVREVFLLGGVPGYFSKLEQDQVDLAKKLVDLWDPEFIQKITEFLETLEMGIARNGNIKILLFDTYLQIHAAFKERNVSNVER